MQIIFEKIKEFLPDQVDNMIINIASVSYPEECKDYCEILTKLKNKKRKLPELIEIKVKEIQKDTSETKNEKE